MSTKAKKTELRLGRAAQTRQKAGQKRLEASGAAVLPGS
jgi:hypothetical protein